VSNDNNRTNADTDDTKLTPAMDETRMASASASAHMTSNSGWLSSTGSVDHGRFAPGTMLDNRYRVLGLLGRGGMGEVYRADDLRLGQQVALKFLPEALAVDARRLAQFHNEVRTARQVSHPNVCRVYDIGEINGQLFLTMEYVDGEDLSILLRRIGRLPEERAIEIARQICAGLAAAHERGILHRDLKPANIMLDSAGKVRIMDFSLAAVGKVEDVRAGTPAYMAPEQLSGLEVTVRSDVYALGLVLYEVFTGRRAFEAKTIADLVAQHQSGSITSPAQLVTSLDVAVDRAIMRCLDADPSRRPSSARAVAASLPGGDPLAAAIAAGETPSPEMVAAAGGQISTITPVASALWLAALAVLLVLCLRITDSASLFSRVPLAKGGEVLADRANELRKSLGYTDEPVDRAHAFLANKDYLAWSIKNLTSADRARFLADGRPAALQFWFRTGLAPLVPRSPLASVNPDDPAVINNGMTSVLFDTEGRLLRFAAAPPQQETTPPANLAPVDWDKLFVAAALDRATFAEATPMRTPLSFADERRAWQGTMPGTQIPVRIEAAGYRGRVVSFEIVGPWTTAPRDSKSAPASTTSNPLLISLLLLGAVVAARANLRSGRADRRGAFRIAAYIFAVIMAGWLLEPHVADSASELQRFFASTGIALFLGAVLYLIYLGLEPFVRSRSPMVLVGWSRVLSGQLRDSLVGRDILVAVTLGVLASWFDLLPFVLSRMTGATELAPFLSGAGALEGVRPFLRDLTQSFNSGLQGALIAVFEWVTFRVVAEWAWHRGIRRLFPGMPMASERGLMIAAIITASVLAGTSGATVTDHLLNALYQFLSLGLLLLVILRVGLLGSVISLTIETLFSNMPLTLDPTKLYAWASWTLVVLTIGLALLGVWMARANDTTHRRYS